MENRLENAYRFLLADDHNIVRQGIQMMLEDIYEEFEIYHASSIAQILESFKNHHFDFAILDAQLQDGNCISILPELKKLQPQAKIMVFTSFEEETHSLKFLQAGADGFLSKLSTESEIQTAILELIQNGKYYPPLTAKLMSIGHNQLNLLNPFSRLSEREMEIVELYAKGLGNLEIANRLDLKQNTVSTFKKRIFEKLGLENLVELIELYKTHHIEM